MINKIGKVFKSSTKAPKMLRGNINRGTGMLKAGLDSPSKMQKLARNLNNIDDAIDTANKAMPGKISNAIGNVSSSYSNAGKNLEVATRDGKFFNKIAKKMQDNNKLNKLSNNIKNHDKAVGFDLKRAVKNDLKLHANQAINFAGSMFEKTDKNLLGVKLNTKGKIVAGGVALASGSKQAATKFNETTMGTQRDSQITPHAPRVPAYQNNGGATGDLVFALNANRRG